MELYNNKEYEEAFAYLMNLAEVGNGTAQYNISLMYSKGEGVPKDPVQAYAWTRMAADTLKNEAYAKSAEEILNSLSAADRKTAADLALELTTRLGAEALKDSLYPQPLSDEECTQEVAPITRTNIYYPTDLLNKGAMGSVETDYTISPQGYVRDLIVTSSAHPSFVQSVIKALPGYRYAPRITNNAAVPAHGHTARFVFQIGNASKAIGTRKIRKRLSSAKKKAEQGDMIEQYRYATLLDDYNQFKSYLRGINLEYQEANKWLLSSAASGLTNAQFELGKNMIEGHGCEVNEPAGLKWINAAAAGGNAPAQHFLAQDLISDSDEQQYRAAVKWLKSSVVLNSYYPSQLMLAWEYSTSVLDDVRNGPAALELLKNKPDGFHDEVRVLETEAAAYAEAGDFEQAVEKQKSAITTAENLDWEIPELHARLANYQAGKPWRGEYFQAVAQETGM